jgi:hypothetical protein
MGGAVDEDEDEATMIVAAVSVFRSRNWKRI